MAWCPHALRRIAMSWNGWGWSWQQQNWGTLRLLCMFIALVCSGQKPLQKRSERARGSNAACTSSRLSAKSAETLGGATTGGRARPSRSSASRVFSYWVTCSEREARTGSERTCPPWRTPPQQGMATGGLSLRLRKSLGTGR